MIPCFSQRIRLLVEGSDEFFHQQFHGYFGLKVEIIQEGEGLEFANVLRLGDGEAGVDMDLGRMHAVRSKTSAGGAAADSARFAVASVRAALRCRAEQRRGSGTLSGRERLGQRTWQRSGSAAKRRHRRAPGVR